MVPANPQTKESVLLAAVLTGGPAKSTKNEDFSADRLAGGRVTAQVAGVHPELSIHWGQEVAFPKRAPLMLEQLPPDLPVSNAGLKDE